MPTDRELLSRACVVAQRARDRGNHPFGALLVDADGVVRLEAENTVVTTGDVTGHAETNLVRMATTTFERSELASMSLFTSTEPCAMCSGAIYWSGIGRVVFALAESSLREMTGDDAENPTLALPAAAVLAAGSHRIELVGPDEFAAARAVHQGFWDPARR